MRGFPPGLLINKTEKTFSLKRLKKSYELLTKTYMLKHDLKVGQKSQKIRHIKNAPLNFAATFQEGLVSTQKHVLIHKF